MRRCRSSWRCGGGRQSYFYDPAGATTACESPRAARSAVSQERGGGREWWVRVDGTAGTGPVPGESSAVAVAVAEAVPDPALRERNGQRAHQSTSQALTVQNRGVRDE